MRELKTIRIQNRDSKKRHVLLFQSFSVDTGAPALIGYVDLRIEKHGKITHWRSGFIK